MPKYTSTTTSKSLRYSHYAAMAGIVIYNNWLLALFLNPSATLAGATTSELAVRGQPWWFLFRLADFVAGVLFVLGMPAIATLGKSNRQRNIFRFILLVLGLSTIFETLVPLACSSALSQTCAYQERFGGLTWQNSFHIYESVITYALLFLLPVITLRAIGTEARFRRLRQLSWLLMVTMVVWGVESLIRFKLQGASFGYEQRIFIIIFSACFLTALQARSQS